MTPVPNRKRTTSTGPKKRSQEHVSSFARRSSVHRKPAQQTNGFLTEDDKNDDDASTEPSLKTDEVDSKERDAVTEKDKKRKTLLQWFSDSEFEFVGRDSFHQIFVRKDHAQILLKICRHELGTPFYNQLTYVGAEGKLPDMVDCTLASAGFFFKMAPNGEDVLLMRMQPPLAKDDLASSLYRPETGGFLEGHVRLFKPVAVDDFQDTLNVVETPEPTSAREAAEHVAIPGDEITRAGEVAVEKRTDTPNVQDSCDREPSGAVADSESALLIDITEWLASFSNTVVRVATKNIDPFSPPRPEQDATQLVASEAFPRNFWFRFMTRSSANGQEVDSDAATLYFTVALCLLPKHPMVPRPKDRRVGYFETDIWVGGARRVTETQAVICRWDLSRHGGCITYCIDPDVPTLFHETIRQGAESWNTAFYLAGCGEKVVRCLAPGEPGFPADYARGDARYNAIYMTDSLFEVFGFGPSIKDFRSGEILVSHVLLGFSAFARGASRHSTDVLTARYVKRTCGCRTPLLDADHQDVLKNLQHTVVHEIGHTLGLRHNFIAQEDGNSSAMAYVDDLDTSSDPRSPVYGGHYLQAPGRYDVYAIKYGYTPLHDECRGERHRSLELLANGQDATDTALVSTAMNPLFATDEDIGGEDPRVSLWNSCVARCGKDKLEYALHQRPILLELVQTKTIFPETYSERLIDAYHTHFRHVKDGLRLLGGVLQDASRTSFSPCSPEQGMEAIRAVIDFSVGPLCRLTNEEGRHFVHGFPSRSYRVDRAYILSWHKSLLGDIIGRATSYRRLEKLEMQRAMWSERMSSFGDGVDAVDPCPLSTFEVLTMLAFGSGHTSDGLLFPFKHACTVRANRDLRDGGSASLSLATPRVGDVAIDQITGPSGALINRASADAIRAEAALAFARRVNKLVHDSVAMAAVRVGARAFLTIALEALKAREVSRGLLPEAAALWDTVEDELRQESEKARSNSSGVCGMLFRQEAIGGMTCGHYRAYKHSWGMPVGGDHWHLAARSSDPPQSRL